MTTIETKIHVQGMPVLRVWRGAVYVRLPRELARPIDGGCSCAYCKAHPAETPAWDTLGIPLAVTGHRRNHATWTVHAPEWQSTDRIPAHERD